MLRKQKDEELLDQIRSGNKNALLRLYKRHLGAVKDLITGNGGTTDDASTLFKEALTILWTELSTPGYELKQSARSYLLQKVRELWLRQHSEIEIRNFIDLKLGKKRRSGRRLAYIGGFSILIALGAWWYFDSQPLKEFAKNTAKPEIPGKIEASSKTEEKPKVKQAKKGVLAASTDSLKSEEDTISGTEAADTITTDETGSEEEFVIRKDELLFTRIIQVIEKQKESKSRTLADETAGKLNPEAGLPDEEEEVKSFVAEFWKSPVNYKGFKMGKSKIIFYGLEEPDWVKLMSLNGNIYMEYRQNFYYLFPTAEFAGFTPVNDLSLVSALKK